jgi:hypothetical protein
MPCSYPQKYARNALPAPLVQRFRVEARRPDGSWEVVVEGENHHRLRQFPINMQTDAIRFTPTSTWGEAPAARIFALEPLTAITANLPQSRERLTWTQVVAKVNPEDLAPPECEPTGKQRGIGA